MISIQDKKILKIYSQEKTPNEWVTFFDHKYTKSQISSYCHRNNYPMRKLAQQEKSRQQSKKAKKYNINQDQFKTWSRNMAYMLGFWFADGCIYKGRLFDITVHKKDKYIIKQFAKELNYKGSILDYVDRQAVRLNFSCAVIYNDIVALGGTERKDLTIQFPNVPDKYLNDFIRGYFDGNGSAVLIKNCRLNTSFYCRNKDFLMSLWKILKDKAGVLGGSYNQNNSSLTFGKRDSILIGQFMYKNNPELFLERKHKKFNPIGGK